MANNLLEELLQELQMLSYKIGNNITIVNEDNPSEEWRNLFAKISDALNYIAWKHAHRFCQIVSSDAFLQLLLSNNKEISISAMILLRKIIKGEEFCKMKHEYQQVILQELIYKLSCNSALLAREASETLASIFSSNPSTIEIVHKHYPMLPDLLAKWCKHGFDSCLLQLKSSLDYSDVLLSEKKRKNAAIKIQSAWRGYAQRKRLANIKKFVIQFQNKARFKIEHTAVVKQKKLDEEHKNFQDHLNKIKSLQRIHEYEQNIMQSASSINWLKISHEDRIKAATCIQRTWRGYRSRLHLKNNKRKLVEDRAARIIQKNVRHWLFQGQISQKKLETLKKQTTDDNIKDKCKSIIAKWLTDNQNVRYSEDQQKELHNKAQSLVAKFLTERSKMQKTVEKLNNLQAQIEIDMDMISNPSLGNCDNAQLYCTFSECGKLQAKKQHLRELAVLRIPWLQHLVDPEQKEME